jgi:hypothetical protein
MYFSSSTSASATKQDACSSSAGWPQRELSLVSLKNSPGGGAMTSVHDPTPPGSSWFPTPSYDPGVART